MLRTIPRVRPFAVTRALSRGPSNRRISLVVMLTWAALGAGCDAASSDAPAASTAASASAESSSAPLASASAEPAEPAHPLAGTWKGSYEAVKGAVVMPPKVKGKTWEEDDGKVLTGPGKVTLVVDDDGSASGHGEGALGPVNLKGEADETTVRITVTPVVPTAENAMTGVLVGQLKDDKLKGRIRVAGPDASIVRESPLALERQE